MENEFNDKALLMSRSSNSTKNFVQFIYKGKEYNSYYNIINDSIIVYEDKEVQDLAEAFDNNPNFTSFLYPDGKMEYFDNYNEYKLKLESIKSKVNEIFSKTTTDYSLYDYEYPAPPIPDDNMNHDAELILFDDANFLDTRGRIYLNKGEKQVSIPHLKNNFSPNMNDKTTSFHAFSMVSSTLFELFEDDNYRSHCMAFIVKSRSSTIITNEPFSSDPEYPILPDYDRIYFGKCIDANLKDNHVIGTKRSSWNDRITSVRITKQ